MVVHSSPRLHVTIDTWAGYGEIKPSLSMLCTDRCSRLRLRALVGNLNAPPRLQELLCFGRACWLMPVHAQLQIGTNKPNAQFGSYYLEKAKSINACQHEANGKSSLTHTFLNSPAACRQSAYASAAIRIVWAAVVLVVAWLNLGLSRELRCGVWGMLEQVKDRARVIDGRLIGMPTLSNPLQPRKEIGIIRVLDRKDKILKASGRVRRLTDFAVTIGLPKSCLF